VAESRAFCPQCYAVLIAGRKTCPKCGRNVSDAPPSKNVKEAASGSATFAVLGALVLVLAIASWVLLR
jgi:hypothetical protein